MGRVPGGVVAGLIEVAGEVGLPKVSKTKLYNKKNKEKYILV